ncbi:sensor domain-containing diguanylate cyclase [Janthinobacterium fluminis]|uniref:diguanylate cyclase n=1 Tax=Janthinobacterium fluminis TaxID=2987524 RepID=A0ABT5K3T2_9BURK|nr:GGDEF domain-containing protein [Janthinobacterium fluminis]MDC8759648.1 diguanylate cyclase [Janthinobacterium fluminis]
MPTARLDQSAIDRLNLQGLSCLIANRKRARRLARLALAAATALRYERGIAYAQVNQLWLAYYSGNAEQAEPMYQPLHARFEACGDLEGSMAIEVVLGAYASRSGDFVLAEGHFGHARALAAHLPDSLHKFMLHTRLGIDALNRGELRSGPRNFLLALDIAERFGTAAHRVNSLSNLASLQHDLGNDEDAIPLLYEALDLIGEEPLPHQSAMVSANLAMCLLASGKAREALALVEPFYDDGDDDVAVRAFVYCIAAHASILVGQLDAAQRLLLRAQAFALLGRDLGEQMHAWLVKGTLDLARGEPGAALEAFGNAHAMLGVTRFPFYEQQIYQGLATVNARLGKWETAYGFLRQHQVLFEASSKSARDSRLLMRKLEREMRKLKEERDRALELQAVRESENQKLEHLNRELAHQIMHVNSLQDSLKEQAIRDHLTGLYNRRHFEACLNAILQESNGAFPVTVVILDLDFFKAINDNYGHACGDAALVQFARLVEGQLRGSDMLCRYGGEEFCLLLREADCAAAANKMAEVASRYRQLTIRQGAHTLSGCTFSAGIAEYPRHGASGHELLMRADGALYAAKQAGRDRVLVAG